MTVKKTAAPKPLSPAARKRAIAQQQVWASVDACTGKIRAVFLTRNAARNHANVLTGEVVELLNVRVQGLRA